MVVHFALPIWSAKSVIVKSTCDWFLGSTCRRLQFSPVKSAISCFSRLQHYKWSLKTTIIRDRLRFFVQVGHASIGNKHFSLNNVIVRLTEIMNRADKDWAHFSKIKYLKNQSFQKISKNFINISWSPNQIFLTEKNGKIRPILDTGK